MFTTFHWKSLAKRHYSTYSLESIKVKPFAIVEQCHLHLLQSFKWNCKHFMSLVAFNQHHCRGISMPLEYQHQCMFQEIILLKLDFQKCRLNCEPIFGKSCLITPNALLFLQSLVKSLYMKNSNNRTKNKRSLFPLHVP